MHGVGERVRQIKQGSWCPECAHANKITRANSKARRRYGNAPLSGE